MIKLTEAQRIKLKEVGRNKKHPDFGKNNPQLDIVLHKLKDQNPDAFLEPQDLIHRVFMIKPKSGFHYKGFVYHDIAEVA
jgi:hypothetical protein